MLKKPICALLVFAIALVAVSPPKVFAQNLVQPMEPGTSLFDGDLPNSTAGPKSDLRKALAAEVARIKAGPVTEADHKRLEKARQNQQSGEPKEGKWTKKNTIFMTLFVVCMTGLVIVLIKHACKDTPAKPCPEIDNTDNSF